MAVRTGITPACAGKRPSRCPRRSKAWDHPRVCGEKGKVSEHFEAKEGSPPRVRGKVLVDAFAMLSTGITPACAGKRCIWQVLPITKKDHPRVCGEKSGVTLPKSFTAGSPPRMRGKGIQPCNKRVTVGITPACAGKSFENLMGQNDKTGSPPRVRGKVHCVHQELRCVGITPACAGKSPASCPIYP